MPDPIRILGITGSLRRDSWNTRVLHAAASLAPADVTIDVRDLRGIPPYDEDVRAKALPEPVQGLRAAIAAADAVLIATPEYNYSIPGVLKNAIDWASRPPEQPFADKPIAIVGATPGRLGTARAQYHLRQVFVFLDGKIMNKPEVMIAGVPGLFDEAGNLVDEPTRDILRDHVAALVAWTRRLQR